MKQKQLKKRYCANLIGNMKGSWLFDGKADQSSLEKIVAFEMQQLKLKGCEKLQLKILPTYYLADLNEKNPQRCIQSRISTFARVIPIVIKNSIEKDIEIELHFPNKDYMYTFSPKMNAYKGRSYDRVPFKIIKVFKNQTAPNVVEYIWDELESVPFFFMKIDIKDFLKKNNRNHLGFYIDPKLYDWETYDKAEVEYLYVLVATIFLELARNCLNEGILFDFYTKGDDGNFQCTSCTQSVL